MEIPRHWRLKLYKGDFRERNPVKRLGIQEAIVDSVSRQNKELELTSEQIKREEGAEKPIPVVIFSSSKLPSYT